MPSQTSRRSQKAATTPHRPPSPSPPVHRPTGASLVVVIAVGVTFCGIMALHAVRSDVDPLRDVMSHYANGSAGPLMSIVFYSFGADRARARVPAAHRDPPFGDLPPVPLPARHGGAVLDRGRRLRGRPAARPPDGRGTDPQQLGRPGLRPADRRHAAVLTGLLRDDPRWWSVRWWSLGLSVLGALRRGRDPARRPLDRFRRRPTRPGTGRPGMVRPHGDACASEVVRCLMSTAGRTQPWWRSRLVGAAVSLAVVGVIFGFFFPKVADYGAVWDTIAAMTWLEITTLVLAALWNLASYWPMLTAVQPGLRVREAAVANLASTAVSNTVPGGRRLGVGVTLSMQRSWGKPVGDTALALVVSGDLEQLRQARAPDRRPRPPRGRRQRIAAGSSSRRSWASWSSSSPSGCSPCCSCTTNALRPRGRGGGAGRVRAVRRVGRAAGRCRGGTSARSGSAPISSASSSRRWLRITSTTLSATCRCSWCCSSPCATSGSPTTRSVGRRRFAAFVVRPPAVGRADHPGRARPRRARAHRRPRIGLARRDEGPDRRRRARLPGPDVAAAGAARLGCWVFWRSNRSWRQTIEERQAWRRFSDQPAPGRARRRVSATAGSMFERRLHALVAGLAPARRGLVRRPSSSRLAPGSIGVPARRRSLDELDAARCAHRGSPIWPGCSASRRSAVMIPLRLLVLGALAWRRRWLQLVAFASAVVASELCIGPLKAVIDRPRPPSAG